MNTPAALTLEAPAEHPFAPFVRILGKGKRGACNLTREEAREAMERDNWLDAEEAKKFGLIDKIFINRDKEKK